MNTKHREVVIFTSGLMKDARPLVEYVYEMWIEEVYLSERKLSSTDEDLFKSLFTEAQLPGHHLHNQYVNIYNHYEDDYKKRPHDTKIYFPSRVYHFEDMREEAVVLENHLSAATQTPNCAMTIWDPREATTRDVLLVCSEIIKQQPVTDLRMVGVTCCYSSLTAPRMINPQALYLWSCDLPSNFVENLIQQLKGSGDSLQMLMLYNMDLSPYESLLDELLENLVAHHEAHKGQRELYLRLWGDKYSNKPTNLSEGFKVKWRKRCEGVESINCRIGH